MSGLAAGGDLRQRVLSGIVLVAVALALTWAGGIWYRLLAALIAGAVLYEWLSMAASAEKPSNRWLAAGLLAILLILLVTGQSSSFLLMALVGAVVVTAAHAARFESGYWPTLGLAYAGLLGISLSALRGGDGAGLSATLFLFAVVWATDILAYFVGRAVGGPKLAPSISPGKTWSGAAGGTVAAVLAGLGAAAFLAGASNGARGIGLAGLIVINLIAAAVLVLMAVFGGGAPTRRGTLALWLLVVLLLILVLFEIAHV